MPALAEKIDLAVGVDPSFQVESQMEVEQGCGWAGSGGGARFGQGFGPGGIGAEASGTAKGGILALNLAVEHDLCGGIVTGFFVGEKGDEAFLQGYKAAFDLAFGLGAGGDEMGYPQSAEGALEFGTGIPVIGHGIMAKEAQAVGVDDQRQAVPEKEAAKVLEMIPGGVGGDEGRAQEFAGMIIHREQQGLLLLGGPPLMDGRIMLPQFVKARAFPSSPGFGAGFGLADKNGKVGSNISGHGLAMALKTETDFQFVGHQLEVGRLLERNELLDKGDGFRRPSRANGGRRRAWQPTVSVP